MDVYTGNLLKKINTIRENIYTDVSPIDDIRFKEGDLKGAEAVSYNDNDWETFSVGQFWGGRDLTCWFRIPIEIPPENAGKRYAVIIQPGKRYFFDASQGGDYREYEWLVYLDGIPLQSIDIRRNEVVLWDKLVPGKKHLLAIEAFSGLETHQHRLEQADLVIIDGESEDFYYNAKIAFETLQSADENHPDGPRIYNTLKKSLLLVDFLQIGQPAFYQSIKKANQLIKKELFSDDTPKKNHPTVVSVGNSHLDIAWMWQTKHSRKKAARTFSNTLRLMEIYPEYRFIQSQAQIYSFLKESYPSIYERIKEKIKNGRLEATGGMWVEPDCNIPNGESLIRQFLYGKRFFEKEFGKENKVVWLPDVFGYCYSLPQIIAKCGLRYFMTTKMSWSQFIKIPNDTFYWEGLDGTRILTHFISTPDPRGWQDYSADLNPKFVKGCWDNYKQKKENKEILFAFGWGDGGCGPTRDMLENSKRLPFMNDIIPNHRQGGVEDFFADLEERVIQLPIWSDELYLQFHRGCYTSQGWIKKKNRQSEILYHNTELFCTIDFLKSGVYPQTDLNKGWELILINQFHDILPGSSIPEVYEDCRKEYQKIESIGEKHLGRALENISSGAISTGSGKKMVVFNALSWKRSDLIRFPIKDMKPLQITDDSGKEISYQVTEGKDEVIAYVHDIPSTGYRYYNIQNKESALNFSSSLKISKNHLENQFFAIDFNENGLITSVFDKHSNREVVEAGKAANILQIFEDRPLRNNAWDIDVFYQDKCVELTELDHIEVIEKGPIRGGLRLKRKFLDSEIIQNIYIYKDIPRIDFYTDVNWQQHETLLKVAFPVNIHANKATYDIPYGNIQRPTHWNTLWDLGRFEVAAQKWADLSEGDYGVSLLNDCKYGYDIKENVIRLTLIKSAIAPDPNADIGHHSFAYSLYPHPGDWRRGGTVQEAYHFNYQPMVKIVKSASDKKSEKTYSFVETDSENVIVETVKKSEDSESVVIRAYEMYNQRGTVQFTFAHPLKNIWECNMLEKDKKRIDFTGNRVTVNFKPYEIKTLMIEF